MKTRMRCRRCSDGIHTSPPGGSALCDCGVKTCACYGSRPIAVSATSVGAAVSPTPEEAAAALARALSNLEGAASASSEWRAHYRGDIAAARVALDVLVAALRDARRERDQARDTLREIGEYASAHSGRDGQDVLLAAVYRIAEECEAALGGAAEETG